MVLLSARLTVDWVPDAPQVKSWLGLRAAEWADRPQWGNFHRERPCIRRVRPPNSSLKRRWRTR